MNPPEWTRIAARRAIGREIAASAVLTYLAVVAPVITIVAALGALTSRVLLLLLMVAAVAPVAVAIGKARLYMMTPRRVKVTPSGLVVERNSGTEQVSSQSITSLAIPIRNGGYLYVGRETGRSIRLGPGLDENPDFVKHLQEMYEAWGRRTGHDVVIERTHTGYLVKHQTAPTGGPGGGDSRTATTQSRRMTPALVMAGASILLALYLSMFLVLEGNLAGSVVFAIMALAIAVWALRA